MSYTWQEVVEKLAPLMGVDRFYFEGECTIDAESFEGDPYQQMHDVFGPIAEAKNLQIYAVEQHDGPKQIVRLDDLKVRRVERVPPDRFRISWGPKPKKGE